MFKRAILSLIIIAFLAVSTISGEAVIPQNCRIKNFSPGYCTWVSLEMCCRHQKIEKGYYLTWSRTQDKDYIFPDGRILPRNYGWDYAIAEKLESLNIKYEMNPTGKNSKADAEIIKRTVQKGKGCVVGVVNGYPTCIGCHAIIIIDWNEKENWFRYIDSNDCQSRYEGTLDWFFSENGWNGFAITLIE